MQENFSAEIPRECIESGTNRPWTLIHSHALISSVFPQFLSESPDVPSNSASFGFSYEAENLQKSESCQALQML
jgi:hypothetical protein